MKVFERLSQKLKEKVFKSSVSLRTVIIAVLFCIFMLSYLKLSVTSLFYAVILGFYIVFSSFLLEKHQSTLKADLSLFVKKLRSIFIVAYIVWAIGIISSTKGNPLAIFFAICYSIFTIAFVVILFYYDTDKEESIEAISNLRMKYLSEYGIVDNVTIDVFQSLENEVKDFLDLSIDTQDEYLFLYDKYLNALTGMLNSYQKASCLLISLMEKPKAFTPKLSYEELTSSEFEQYNEINFKIALKTICKLLQFSFEEFIKNEQYCDLLYRSATSIITYSNVGDKTSSLLVFSQLLSLLLGFH